MSTPTPQRGGTMRGSQRKRPGDLTGTRYNAGAQRAAAEKQAKQGLMDPEELRNAAYVNGWNAGYDMGVEAVLRQLREAGLDLDADEPEDDQ